MYYISEDVYFVRGGKNSALYDLKHNKIYQLNNEATIFLDTLLTGSDNEYSLEEVEFTNKLIELDLLKNKYVKLHNIYDLKNDNNIDFVWIEITTGCNLKCIHCYEESDCQKKEIMDIDIFRHIIDELVSQNVKKIQLIGGEPFILGEKIFEYLNYCVGKFEYIEIFTNGTMVKEEWLSYIKNNNIRLALSVYSYEENSHCYVTRNKYSWELTNNLIKKLSELEIKYRVRNVLMKNVNIGKQNTDLYRLSRKRDIVRLTGRAKLNLLTDELIRKKLITPKKLTKKIDKNLISRCVSGHNCFSRRLYFSCKADVFPCVMERRFKHGNIKGRKLKDVINSDIQNMTKEHIDGCMICEFRFCCFDCRPDSNGNGKYDKPWYCTYNPIDGKWETDIDSFIKNLRDEDANRRRC